MFDSVSASFIEKTHWQKYPICFVQALTLGFGLFYTVRMLAVIKIPSEIGPILAVCLLTPFYGVLANLVLKMYVLFGRSEIQAE